ncbi:hypothetical protein [Umezawaea sp. Da 62-37]|uniref:hypothetical protein n=1 Tax=Umezawaea sp. Da 62-37 TaxID=3075927 RepID=UPI0028F6FAF8|nr:hypothetical protein [Umezawaea sp. Da 62-37]WNV83094.1 hypothetical protein RM788_33560 [Umezawaea sp. Da 62-37]
MTAVEFPALADPLSDRVLEHVAQQAVHQAQAMLGLLRPSPSPTMRSLASVRGEPPPRVVLNLGLGRDSVAILARWLTDPSSRDFDLSELAVITGMTGQEWPAT